MFNNILLAADDLEHARKAAQLAGETARRMRSSSLRIVVAYPSVPDYLGGAQAEQETGVRMTRAEATAGSLRQAVGAIPGEVQTEVLEGTVAEVALAASRVFGSDLVLMPAQEPGLWDRLKAWFRNFKAADRVGCPVMIVQ
jgi:nucleotide-binding universal stress UspA family protein